MSKMILEDVRPPERRSIREVELPEKKRARTLHAESAHTDTQASRTEPKSETRPHEHRAGSHHIEPNTYILHSTKTHHPSSSHGAGIKFLLWCVGVILAITLFFIATSFFTGATLTVSPKHQTVALNSSFVAGQDSTTGLSYKVVTLEKEGSQTISGTGHVQTTAKASGQITIYNNDSVNPQILVKNTRFETPEGLTFRINQPVSVPGKTASKPGSITVTVYADKPGPQYNIGLSDFTLPGLKSNPQKFQNIFGRSKTIMTGGADGTTMSVSDADRQTAITNIQSKLTNELTRQTKAQIPSQYILYDKGIFISFQQQPDQNAKDGSVTITQKGTLNAILLEKSSLNRLIALNTQTSYNGKDEIDIPDLASLDFTIKATSTPQAPIWMASTVPFTLNGQATIVWQYSQDKLKQALAGQSSDDISRILATFPSIDKADAVISPFWQSSFPTNQGKIKIVNKI